MSRLEKRTQHYVGQAADKGLDWLATEVVHLHESLEYDSRCAMRGGMTTNEAIKSHVEWYSALQAYLQLAD